MRDGRFEVLVWITVCATVGVVAVRHGLGGREVALWVGVAAIAAATFEVALIGARRFLPRTNPLQQINFAAAAVSATAAGILMVDPPAGQAVRLIAWAGVRE